jgi:hypothetical protein
VAVLAVLLTAQPIDAIPGTEERLAEIQSEPENNY